MQICERWQRGLDQSFSQAVGVEIFGYPWILAPIFISQVSNVTGQ